MGVIYDVKIINIERKSDNGRKGLLMNKMYDFKDTNAVENCGMRVTAGDKIKWNYIGTLTNGKMFDSGDFSATIDAGHVISGVNEAMKGLCVGGERRMIMHHEYAYGARGTSGIPGYSNLIFNVKLNTIDRPGVGMEDFEFKKLKGSVTVDDPVKVMDSVKTGNCDVKVTNGAVVTWKGIGYLLTGKIFDQYEVPTTIGDESTLPALENALLGLCVGDARSIMIHQEKAFGASGVPGMVPMNTTVIYDFNIVKISKSEL